MYRLRDSLFFKFTNTTLSWLLIVTNILIAPQIFSGDAQATQGAWVKTDKPDYAPGETAAITGGGFLANESTSLQVVHTDGTNDLSDADHQPWYVNADSQGNIASSWYISPLDSFGSSFLLTALGMSSQLSASTTFTDGLNVGIDFSQCRNDNGTAGSPTDLTGAVGNDGKQDTCNWVAGNLGGSNSIYQEGDVVPQRALRAVPTAGAHFTTMDHSFSDTSAPVSYTYDFFATPDFTLGSSILPDHELLTPCNDIPTTGSSFGGLTYATCLTLFNNHQVVAIPTEGTYVVNSTTYTYPHVTDAEANALSDGVTRNLWISCGQVTGSGANQTLTVSAATQCTNVVLTVLGHEGSNKVLLPGAQQSGPPSLTGDDFVAMKVDFTTPLDNEIVAIWVGGHLAKTSFWHNSAFTGGYDNQGAASASGSNFHVRLTDWDENSAIGNQDNQVQANVVVPPGSLTIIKDDLSDSGTAFTFHAAAPLSPTTFTLSDDGVNASHQNQIVFSNLISGNTYGPVTEDSTNGFSLQSINCTGASAITTTATGITIDQLQPGDNIVCTFTNKIEKASPTISTSATGPVTVGATIHDVATLSGASSPTGTISFQVFAPGDTTCATPIAVSPDATVSGNGNYNSGDYTTTVVGTYLWRAFYSGDAHNNPVSTPCNDTGESSTTNKATPTISTTATGPVTVGGTIHDVATLSGGYGTLSGTISFQVFAPGDTTCATPIAVTPDATVSGAGNYNSGDYTTTVVGTYLWRAFYSGDSNNNAVSTPCNDTGESSTTNNATPTISTSATGPVTVGGSIHDVATIGGGYGTLGGTISFQVFAPGDTTCSTPIAVTPDATVSGAGNYNSGDYTTTVVGTYLWRAFYSGDAHNNAVSTPCNDTGESSTTNKATPTISTSATGPVTVGGAIHDVATLGGGYGTLSGTISFQVFAPGDTTCATPIAVSPNAIVNGAGNYSSGNYTTTVVGTYLWRAFYSGDSNNNAVSTPCNDTGESSAVNKASPTISTSATGPVTVGAMIHDVATLSGGYGTLTGTISFQVFAPGDTTCSTPIALTPDATVNGAGNYNSGNYTTTLVGTYLWRAFYSGDSKNNAVNTPCNDTGESSTTYKATPTISTSATGPVTVGAAIHDVATLGGGYGTLSGTISFQVFAPGDTTCSTPIAVTPDATVIGAGNYNSGDYTTTTVGTYLWRAFYSGDAFNSAVSTPCNDTGESSTVNKASPSIATSATDATGASTNVSDSATLSGGVNPTGTITFRLYGPSATASCTSANLVFTSSAVTVNGAGTYGPVSFSPTAVGKYYWIASYSGDANNNAVSGTCGDTGETSTVNPGFAAVIKTVNTLPPSGTQAFTFQLRSGASTLSDGTTLEQVDASILNSWSINFTTALIPGQHYQLCEWVMPGWNTTLGPNLFVPNSIIPPSLPNPTVNNMTVCTDFIAQAGRTMTFNVDNTTPPGGRALTIGFWKNWASCKTSGGNQAPTLDQTLAKANVIGDTEDGHSTLPGIVLSATSGTYWKFGGTYYLDVHGNTLTPNNAPDCQKAVALLNKSTVATGKKMSSDPIFNMVAQLLAAELNLAAGAGNSGSNLSNINAAVLLDGKYKFDGNTYTPKLSTADANKANCLATQLDNYNNDRIVSTCP